MLLTIMGKNCEIDDSLLIAIVRAIDKAVSEDVPNQRKALALETNNYIPFIRGDFINQNLRDFTNTKGAHLHGFSRFGWKGRLLLSSESKLTISITTQNNLNMIPRKKRKRPHFMQSILHCLNGDLHGQFEQTRMYDTDYFEPEEYVTDFADIIDGVLSPEDGYRHCVIAYNAFGDELRDVKLVVLDPWFNVVTEVSLAEYMTPDFARLTDPVPAEETARNQHNVATQRLVSLKPRIKPSLQDQEKKA